MCFKLNIFCLVSQTNETDKIQKTSVANQVQTSTPSLLDEDIPVADGAVQVKCKPVSKRKSKQNKSKQNIPKVQESAATVSSAHKRPIRVTAKHTEKKIQINSVRTGMIEKESNCQVLYKKKKLKRLQSSSKNILSRRSSTFENSKQFKQFATENLIELYHNAGAKGSDSDDSNGDGKTKKLRHAKVRQKAGGNERIPPLPIHSNHPQLAAKATVIKQHEMTREELVPVRETDYDEPEAPRIDGNNLYGFSRSYELPTIASKLKEVAKSYLHSFNFRSIPFCAAKSTTPSHNIGINIQQVMSIIKTRQPVDGISPTLAHNIGLVAEKLNSKPLHALVSTLSSRMG